VAGESSRETVRVIRTLLVVGGLCLLSGSAVAELPQPLLWSVFPAGGRQAATVEVAVAGVDLDDGRLLFEHPGITACPARPEPSELLPAPEPTPNRFQVTIDPAVPPGFYEVVCWSRFGVSNPRLFAVGTAEEFSKPVTAQSASSPLHLPLPATVNGRAGSGAIDHYAVDCVAGSQLQIEMAAERLDSRLTPVLKLLGPDGSLLATAGERPAGDPLISLVVPTSGRFQIQVHDLFMGGGNDWFYRLAVSATPAIRSVWPPLAQPEAEAEFLGTLQRTGLPTSRMPLQGSLARQPRTSWRRLRRLLSPHDVVGDLVDLGGPRLAGQASPVPVLITPATDAAVVIEHSGADVGTMTTVPNLPARVVGRWEPTAARHAYRFDATAGSTWVFDLFSRRLGCRTDPALELESMTVSASGEEIFKEVAFADDRPKAFAGKSVDGLGLDPVVSFKVPATGRYRLTVTNLDGGDRSPADYVLEIRRPRPDFDLLAFLAIVDRTDVNNKMRLATPSLVRGGTAAIDVLVLRHDGFAGPVVVTAEQLPTGVRAEPLVIPASSNRGSLVLEATAAAPASCRPIRLVGRARIGDAPRLRVARGATLRWPITSRKQPHQLREVAAVYTAVTSDVAAISVRPESPQLSIAAGTSHALPLAVTRTADSKGPLTLKATGLPKLLKVDPVTVADKATAATVKITADAKLPPGDYAVVLSGISKRMFRRHPEAAARAASERDRLKAVVAARSAARDQQQTVVAGFDVAGSEADSDGSQPSEPAASRPAAEKVLADLTAGLKAATEALARAEQRFQQRQKAAAAKQIDVPITLPPITVRVTPKPKPQ